MAVKLGNNIQFISILPKSPINPMKDFKAMIIRDVAMALFMGSCKKRINTGTIKSHLLYLLSRLRCQFLYQIREWGNNAVWIWMLSVIFSMAFS